MNNCKGCDVFSREPCIFRSLKHWAVKDCPCEECLIKMMCVDPCEPYTEKLGDQMNKVSSMTQKESSE